MGNFESDPSSDTVAPPKTDAYRSSHRLPPLTSPRRQKKTGSKAEKPRGREEVIEGVPIGSMYGIFTYIWLIFMVSVAKYTIHGYYGVQDPMVRSGTHLDVPLEGS